MGISATIRAGIKVTADTVSDAKGASEVCKVVTRTIDISRQIFPDIGSGWIALRSELKEFTKIVDILEIVKLIKFCANPSGHFYQMVGLITYLAGRVIAAVKFVAELKIVDLANIATDIGNVPVIGGALVWIGTRPFQLLFLISSIFDTIHQVKVELYNPNPAAVTSAKWTIATNVAKFSFNLFTMTREYGIGLTVINVTWGAGMFAAATPFMLTLGVSAAAIGVIRIAHKKANNL